MELNTIGEVLRRQYGTKVYKLALSSGCSCPNRDGTVGSRGCLFCDGAGAFAARGDIPQQLESARNRVAAKAGPNAKYIAYFQSFTNTYGSAEHLRTLFVQAMEPPDVVILSIATRPDCLPPEMIRMLAELARQKPVWVELGLQTMHPDTARLLRRGYELPVYERAVRELKAVGIPVIAHQILGLPGEDAERMAQTARYLGDSGAAGIKFHLLHVLRGTDLAAEWEAGRVRTLELEEYLAALERCVRVIPPEMVIHRLTGDGAKRDLLAPLWSADKKRVLNAIHAAFALHDVRQGSDRASSAAGNQNAP